MEQTPCEEKLISGKILAQQIKEQIAKEVEQLKKDNIFPKLTVIIVGENPASQTYVKGKHKDCLECGIISDIIELPENVPEKTLISQIHRLNEDSTVHGILVQLPLPEHIDEYSVINAISPTKDVDGFTAVNVGKMHIGKDCYIPCTPQACMDVIDYANIDLSGKNVVVIGRSNIVGKPVAALMLQRNATITICHSRTNDLTDKTIKADIIVLAVGKAYFLKGDMIKQGAVVIDVGINKNDEGKLCGDADFASCIDKVSKITPVPGGIGLLTRANLLKNTIKSAKNAGK